MQEHEINSLNNFIMGWYQDDYTVPDNILEYFNSATKNPGSIYNANGDRVIDKNFKDSLDCHIDFTTDLLHDYAIYLQNCVQKYIEKYPMSNMQAPWSITQGANIQYYPPGGGFYQWHYEQSPMNAVCMSRNLVFMTYLNDVNDGGETEFDYQNIKIKPEKGLTVIWPAGWPFTHRGVVSETEKKYIITGWYNYLF